MNDLAHKKIENKVLHVYRQVSPSIINIKDEKHSNLFLKRREILLNNLSIPKMLFQNKKLIDIGGGTGEKSLLYAHYGAKVTLLEPNEKSCNYAINLFRNAGMKVNVINSSLFDFQLKSLREFDIIVCEGVLHHTYNPMKGLQLILSNMKKDAIIILGICETNGWIKRSLQRLLIRKLAGTDENEIIRISKKYFSEHLSRAVKFGMRSEESIIYDTYVNPQIKPTSLKDIFDTFFDNGIQYLSAYPSINFCNTKPLNDFENMFDYKNHRRFLVSLEKIWATSGEEPEDLDITNIIKHQEKELLELKILKQKIKNKTFSASDLCIIQKGYLGIGINYFVGVKQ